MPGFKLNHGPWCNGYFPSDYNCQGKVIAEKGDWGHNHWNSYKIPFVEDDELKMDFSTKPTSILLGQYIYWFTSNKLFTIFTSIFWVAVMAAQETSQSSGSVYLLLTDIGILWLLTAPSIFKTTADHTKNRTRNKTDPKAIEENIQEDMHTLLKTDWPLEDLDAILNLQISILFYWLVSSDDLMIMPSDEYHETMI